jgi:hypothetical protein
MEVQGAVHSLYGLENHSIQNVSMIYGYLSTSLLCEESIRRREGHLAYLGPLVVRTGHHTGRSPNDKCIVHLSRVLFLLTTYTAEAIGNLLSVFLPRLTRCTRL